MFSIWKSVWIRIELTKYIFHCMQAIIINRMRKGTADVLILHSAAQNLMPTEGGV